MTNDVSFRNLKVWQKAMDLAEICYEATSAFPKEELYGMTSQMRRCSVSIAANIAEGYGRDSDGSFIQFLRISQGSIKELETHIILAGRLGMLNPDRVTSLLERTDELGKMMRGLINSVQSKSRSDT
ncbi:four helix bundle protein [Hyphococcus flavus]|uniref:Four helix bundle protein n=1 Tax=Hyphococcus flavus TaxID=1866326 RepID=A0AAF0CHE7_9PROT|nr:four helix bundle protein [Hyphococcus flavus]WDI31827.1 four helix bundle protein [Hyphococcus flavus]